MVLEPIETYIGFQEVSHPGIEQAKNLLGFNQDRASYGVRLYPGIIYFSGSGVDRSADGEDWSACLL